jgi:hypothetical protein
MSFLPKHLVMACHITGVHDVNRNQILPNDAYDIVADWVTSIRQLNLRGVLFHNSFSETTCAAHQNEHVEFVRITHDSRFNPNVYRYRVYLNFLQAHANEIEGLFITDVSDVVAVNNPFVQPLFQRNPDALFCGDEPARLRNDWMLAHGAHLREQMAEYANFETQFADSTLLNCGIIGGSTAVMLSFLEQLCLIHQRYNTINKTGYTGDMGAFNYVARTRFNDHLRHGEPVNTVFKGYEHDRTDCWFRHK